MSTASFRRTCIFVFAVASATAVITPLENANVLDVIDKITGDFRVWEGKREQFLRYSKDYPNGWPGFDCPIPGSRVSPQDVHHLAPWDISVIGALGDSLTAGRAAGAEQISELLSDYRGLSFATGMDRNLTEQASLYNIFSQFSPGLKGGSIGIGLAEETLTAGFDMAISGAVSADLPEQVTPLELAVALVRRIRSDPNVNFDKDWKFVNIFIGSNDLCSVCLNETRYGPGQYIYNMRKTLLYLRDNLPRTYVNILPPFNVDNLLETHKSDNAFCEDYHSVACPCVYQLTKEQLGLIKKQYNDGLDEFMTAAYQTENFTVAISTGFDLDKLPTLGNQLNLAFIALDCFHFSHIAHDLAAKVIWQDLFKPIASRKPVDLNEYQPQLWTCPPQDCPYLKTPLNSELCSDKSMSIPVVPWKQWVKYENTVFVPSIQEMERRAFMEEHGTVFMLLLLALALLCGLLCLTVAFCCRSKQRYPMEINERTKLLDSRQII